MLCIYYLLTFCENITLFNTTKSIFTLEEIILLKEFTIIKY